MTDPGQYFAIVSNDFQCRQGLRDTLLVLVPGPRVLFVHLHRNPLSENTLAEQILANGLGALWINGCRVQGRWPPNLILVHAADCLRHTDRDWSCVAGCPAQLLDKQSGVLTSGQKVFSERHRDVEDGWGFREGSTSYGDSGGASRYFPQFADLRGALEWVGRLINGDPRSST